MDILTEHRDGEITVFTNNSTPEIHLTTRRAEAKEEVAENMGAVTTVADNMEEVKGAAKYAQTFDDVLLNLPTIIKAMPAAETAVQAKDDAISAKESAQESAEKAESAVVRAEEVTAEQVELAKGYAEQAKTEVSKISSAFKIVGTVPTVEDLPKNAEVGNIYLVGDNSITNKPEYVWTSGGTWEKFGETVDLSAYQTKEEAETALAEKQDTLTAGEGIKIEGNVISTEGGKLPDNVYTQDNLIAGDNVTFSDKKITVGLDDNTIALFHFDNSILDSSNHKNSGNYDYSSYLEEFDFPEGKFGKALNVTSGNYENIYYKNDAFTTADSFTLDYWTYLRPVYTGNCEVRVRINNDSDAIRTFAYYYGGNKYLYIVTNSGQAIYEATCDELKLNDCNHYAVQVDNKNTCKIFINGKLIATVNTNVPSVSSIYKLNVTVTGDSYIDEVRLSNVVRYDGDFTPETKAYSDVSETKTVKAVNAIIPEGIYTQSNLLGGKDIEIVPEPAEGGIDEYTAGLFHFDESPFLNEVENGNYLQNMGCGFETGLYKFGKGCGAHSSLIYLGYTTGQYLTVDGDWTVDQWVRFPSAGTSYYHTLGLYDGQGTYPWYVIFKTDPQTVRVVANGVAKATEEVTIPINEWFHIASEKKGTTINGYLNGVKVISYTDPSITNLTNNYRYLYSSAGQAINYTDELRFSNTARYEGESFTPPTKAYEVAKPTGNMVVNFVGEKLQKGADYVVESYNDGTNWYRIYKSGWIEQGGVVSSSTGEIVISMLKPLKDTNYTLLVTATDPNVVCTAHTLSKTNTSFKMFVGGLNGSGQTAQRNWSVFGQGA